MAVIGTFGSFTAARLGIYASQSSLNVTGNNIANINTKGYTRQRMDLVSLHSWGTARYANKMNHDIGYGVLCDSVSQLRDPFMDIRYRNEQSNVGASETWMDCLQQLSHTLDEVGDGDDFGIIERQFNEFAAKLQDLKGNVGTEEYDTITRASAEVLCNLFNNYSKALDTVENSQLKNLKDDVTSVNTILTQIRDLNEEIREAGIHGAKALELRDARNVLIDELSTYVKIDVSYDMEKIDEFNSVERLNINIADSGNPPTRLICGVYSTQLDMPEKTEALNPDYRPDLPTSKRYIDATSTPGNIVYTNEAKDALRDKNGQRITNDPAGEALIKQMDGFANGISAANMYGNGPAGSMGKYLDKDGNPTDDAEQAEIIDNAVEGSDNNRVWMSVRPLVDKKDRVFRNSDGSESKKVDLGDNVLYGSLQSLREFITGKGEFSSEMDVKYDKDATTTRGVPYYRMSLDALAKKFADMFNQANQVDFDKVADYYTEESIKKLQKPDGTQITPGYFQRVADMAEKGTLTEEKRQEAYGFIEQLRLNGELKPEYAYYNGGVMFSKDGDGNDMSGITAANITISKAWSTGEVRILNSKKPDILIPDPNDPDGEGTILSHTTANDNIAHMVNLMGQKLDFMPKDADPNAAGTQRYFNGTFQERFSDMGVILAVDQQTTTTLYNSYSVKSLNLENDRQSVSGVDLNDEATNMMVFQKSYSAACQLMTTLDSMLERLINGTLR